MARTVSDPLWKREWYDTHQKEYEEWLEQAKSRGLKDDSGSRLYQIGQIEKYIWKKLRLSESAVKSWRRKEGASGATYPDNIEILLAVRDLLRPPMLPEDRAAARAVCMDFRYFMQDCGRAFVRNREDKYGKYMDKSGLFKPLDDRNYLRTGERCELVGKLEKKGYLSREQGDALLEFYEKFPLPADRGGQALRELCEGEIIWRGIHRETERCAEAEKEVLSWLNEIKNFRRKEFAPGKPLYGNYWKIVDEYMEAWQDRIPDKKRVREFKMLKIGVKGYVPMSFDRLFGYNYEEERHQKELRREYIENPEVCETITTDEGVIRLSDHADVSGWFEQERKNHGVSIENYREHRKNMMRRELEDALCLQSDKVRSLLSELKLLGQHYGQEFEELDVLDRAACLMTDALEALKKNRWKMGFSNGREEEEALCRYRKQKLSEEKKTKLAVQYMLTCAPVNLLNVWWKEWDQPLFSDGFAELLGEELFEKWMAYLLYWQVDEKELLRHLKAIGRALALRREYLPKLETAVSGIPQEVLAQKTDSEVLDVIRHLKSLLEHF